MKFIPPLEIASKIMTLIEDTNEYLVVVSPYVNFKTWDKMKLRLKRAIDRGVKIEFYVRQNADVDMEQFKELGITPIKILDLHAKLYYNEAYAIVTSQNMIKYSDENSIDIGYVTENEEELKQLINFTNRNLKTHSASKAVLDEQPIQHEPVKIEETATRVAATPALIDTIYSILEFVKGGENITRTKEYIFSNKLIGAGDMMAGTDFTVKLYKSNPNWKAYMDGLKGVDCSVFKHRFILDVKDSHERYSYVSFIPVTIIDAQVLANDYVYLINKLTPILQQKTTSSFGFPSDWKKYLTDTLSSRLNWKVQVYSNYDKLEIKTKANNYTAFIANERTNNLRISGILSRKELEYAQQNNHKIPYIPDMKIDFVGGRPGYYDTAWGTSKVNLQSQSLSRYKPSESKLFADLIIGFVTSIEEFKQRCN